MIVVGFVFNAEIELAPKPREMYCSFVQILPLKFA